MTVKQKVTKRSQFFLFELFYKVVLSINIKELVMQVYFSWKKSQDLYSVRMKTKSLTHGLKRNLSLPVFGPKDITLQSEYSRGTSPERTTYIHTYTHAFLGKQYRRILSFQIKIKILKIETQRRVLIIGNSRLWNSHTKF